MKVFSNTSANFYAQLLLAMVLLTGCGVPSVTTIETPTADLTTSPTSSPEVPSPTKSPTSLSDTPFPTQTPALLVSETPMPGHALPLSDAQSLALELLQSNENCLFPCWWGLIPGITSAQDAKLFLEGFQSISWAMIFDDNGGYVQLPVSVDTLTIRTDLDYEVNIQRDTVELLSIQIQVLDLTQKDDLVVYENPIFERVLHLYTLPEIPSTYRLPSDVQVRAIRGFHQFDLLLYYPEVGTAVNYVSPLVRTKDRRPFSRSCPDNASVELYRWSPETLRLFTGKNLPDIIWRSIWSRLVSKLSQH